MQDSDDELFLREMADVEPIKRQPRVRQPAGARRGSDPSLAARREAAIAVPGADANSLAEEGVEPLDPWYVLDFKRPGVQNGVFRKLKQGRYEAEARLDLHRMSVAVARRELFSFVQEAMGLGLRSVLVIHGRGERGPERDKNAVLKGYTRHWLQQLDPVMAFHSARPQHGGTGAVYVLLQKSEEKKRENRERFMKGRERPAEA
jgi:DNA-nicking Smr family endonuclease